VKVHADPPSTESDALGFQAQLLIGASAAGEENLTSGTEHAVPGKPPVGSAQSPDDLPRRTGKSGRFRDRAVSGDFASRDFPDHNTDFVEHL
jgi:hypothetical protein